MKKLISIIMSLLLSGLKGGHSGVEIDKGRLNGIKALAAFLNSLQAQGIGFELAAFEGGTANNAIPNRARCQIVVSAEDKDRISQLAAEYQSGLEATYAGVEQGICLTVSASDAVPAVVSEEDRQSMIRFMAGITDGVYTMSPDMEGLVESSSNLGVAALNADGFHAGILMRSSVARLEEELLNILLRHAEACGLEVSAVRTALPWAFDPNSRLMVLAQEVYREQNGEEINVVAVHAGLECGVFKVLNPSLDMISIGPDLTDVHTTAETFHLDTLPKVWHLLEGLLASVS